MRRVAVSAFLSFLATSAAGQEATQGEYAPLPEFRTFGKPASEADATAISALMSRFSSSWARQDVDAVVAAYAEDAEWVNAFGLVYRGHTELQEGSNPCFSASRHHGAPTPLRKLPPNQMVSHRAKFLCGTLVPKPPLSIYSRRAVGAQVVTDPTFARYWSPTSSESAVASGRSSIR